MRWFFYTTVLLVGAGLAAAHSKMDETMPADGATLDVVPQELVLRFEQAIRLVTVKIIHADEHSEPLKLDEQAGFGTEFKLPMTSMGTGRYEVEWRGLGEDGHVMTGRFGFDVQ